MANPELTYLRQLMGDGWVDVNILGEDPRHLLGRWQHRSAGNPWVPYTEELVKAILASDKVRLDHTTLKQKLDADYGSTLAEMEVTAFLLAQGFSLVVEPTAPEKGPDLQANWGEVPYFIEVRAVGDSEEDDRFNSISRELFQKLNEVPSSYFAAITVGDSYKPGSQPLRRATDAVLESLNILKEENWRRATLYYSEAGTLLNPGGPFGASAPDSSQLGAKHRAIADAADFIVRFRNVGSECPQTAASMSREFRRQLQPDQSHERIKKILKRKKEQLPKDARGVLLLDGSELAMLNDFAIEAALYGDLVVTLTAPATPGGPIGEPTMRRNGRGFFRYTSRVSAVVIHRRHVESEGIRSEWQVYPTNRANADTIRLSLEELERFGNLGDRAHLSAENVPGTDGPQGVTDPGEENGVE
jgi:hypothetical protein